MIGVAQADREDRDVPLGRDRRRLPRIRLLVVAIGDQKDRLIAIGPSLKDLESLADRVADGRAAPWRAHRIELVERSAKCVVIDRERTFHHRRSGEGNQANALPFESIDQGCHIGLGPTEPAGWNILCEHRARDVDQHVKVAAAGNDLLILCPEPRAGQRDECRHQGRFAQRPFQPESGR